MIESDLVMWFRQCRQDRKDAILAIVEGLAAMTKREEEQRKAAPTAQVITFKPRAELAKEA